MQQQQREMNFEKTTTTATVTLCFQGSFCAYTLKYTMCAVCVCALFSLHL